MLSDNTNIGYEGTTLKGTTNVIHTNYLLIAMTFLCKVNSFTKIEDLYTIHVGGSP